MKGASRWEFEEGPQGSSSIWGRVARLSRPHRRGLKAAPSEREREQLAASDHCRHPADPAREVRNSTAGTLFLHGFKEAFED